MNDIPIGNGAIDVAETAKDGDEDGAKLGCGE